VFAPSPTALERQGPAASSTTEPRPSPSGRQRVGEFGPHDIVGEMALLTGNPRMADVTAEESGFALALSTQGFQELVQVHPQLAVVLTHMVAARLGQTSTDGLGGKTVDRYRISRCIGRGGMAIVYEARELESGRTVALKMMSHRLVYEPSAQARFRREADVLFLLEHRNIARVFRRFNAYRTLFFAMEYCDGGDLLSMIRRGFRPDEKETRRLVGQLAAGLAFLHSRGVVHRDVKPSNVLVTREGLLKLADFGLATDLPSRVDSSMVTPAGVILGTPHYMAPEQMDGAPATTRSDVYALGCVLLEVLTGRPPFSGTGLYEILENKRSLALPARSELGPRGISRRLYSVLQTCLACEPEQRKVDLKALARWGKPLRIPAGLR